MQKFIYIFLLGAYIVVGCKDDQTPNPPVAEFSAENNFCVEPCTLTFYNNSQFENAISWDFGNGITSTDSTVQVGYETAGKYWVTLTASNVNGVEDEEIKEITIVPLQTMQFDTLTLEQFPELNNSQTSWDASSNADIYFALMLDTDTIYSSSANYWSDLENSMLPLSISPGQNLDKKLEPYQLLVIDKDGGSGEIIEVFDFHLYDYSNYPNTITFEQDSTIVKAAISWQ